MAPTNSEKKAETILVNLSVVLLFSQGIGGFCCLWAQCWLQHGPFHVGTDGGIQRCRTHPRKFKAKHVKVILSGQYPRLISALPSCVWFYNVNAIKIFLPPQCYHYQPHFQFKMSGSTQLSKGQAHSVDTNDAQHLQWVEKVNVMWCHVIIALQGSM